METEKTLLFEQDPIPKAVAVLSVPTVLSSLVMVIYSMADTYFVGLLNDPVETAAVTLVAPVLFSFNAVNNLFGVGSSSLMSRSLGVKDYDTFRLTSAFAFYCSIICGIIFSLAATVFKSSLLAIIGADAETSGATGEYLMWAVQLGAAPAILNVVFAYLVRSEGNSLHASIGTMSGCILNIILDPIFILPQGLNMGAAGAGLATFVSNCVACVYFFVLLFVIRKKTLVCIKPSAFRIRRYIVRNVFAIGIPSSIQNLLNVTGMAVINNFTAAYNSTALAAMGIVQKLYMVPMNIAIGLSQGIMPLISYNYADKNTKRMKDTVIFSAEVTLAFILICTVLYYIKAGFFVSLFIKNDAVIEYGISFMRGVCLALPFICIDFTAVGVFQACGMGRKAFVFAVLRMIAFEIPAIIILDHLFPLYGVAYAQFTAELFMAVIAVVVLVRLFKGLDKSGQSKDRIKK